MSEIDAEIEEVEPGEEGGNDIPRPPPVRRGKLNRRTLAIFSSRGGAGATVIGTNLATYLASIGRRVSYIDADPLGPNGHSVFACPSSTAELAPTQFPGLYFFNASNILADETPDPLATLVKHTESAQSEYVLLDGGIAGTRSSIEVFAQADLALLVVLPEPSAIENAYRFLKEVMLHRLRANVGEDAKRQELDMHIASLGTSPSPLDLLRRLTADADSLADYVAREMARFNARFVISQTRLRADLELGDAIRTVVRRRLGLILEYMGPIDYDDAVWNAVRNRKILLVESPGAKASKCIERIARKVLTLESAARVQNRPSLPVEIHHDLLEVGRGATDEEIRRAYKRAKEIYAPQGLACSGLFETYEIEALLRRLEEAHDVLLDPARRRPYELSVFPSESVPPPPAPSIPIDPMNRPRPPIITPDTEFTGDLIRQIRESQGITLEDISLRTRIGTGYLRAIELDEFPSLPALVYVRGFVAEVAKVLRLDPVQVSSTYLRRYRRFLEERGDAR